jgi:hypothetical protein
MLAAVLLLGHSDTYQHANERHIRNVCWYAGVAALSVLAACSSRQHGNAFTMQHACNQTRHQQRRLLVSLCHGICTCVFTDLFNEVCQLPINTEGCYICTHSTHAFPMGYVVPTEH